MSRKVFLASLATEKDLLDAVRGVRKRGWHIVDLYTPYAVHGLEEILGWSRSWLSAACLLGGAAGVGLSLWFQFWATATDWPLNVGGRPWNSLPAFVPVTFECMVLLGGFALVFAWLFRCRLYPGKSVVLPQASLTDDRFALLVCAPDTPEGSAEVRQLLHDCNAVEVQERDDEESYK
jgi:hypothetical protein